MSCAVPLDEPSWWYGPANARIVRALEPVSRIYAGRAAARLVRRQAYRSRLPVICVGNFTAGGTGKTPLALHLAGRLRALGERPAMLTRGYGGRRKGPYWVDGQRDAAGDVGDEPLLLARVAPTLVARDRRAGAIAIETAEADYTVIVMDDGLQNPALVKDLTLAVVDDRRGLGNGEVIPAGPLRMRLQHQLPLTDAIVVNASPAGAEGPAVPVPLSLATLRREFPGPVLAARVDVRQDHPWLSAGPLIAFAGIANPDRFFALVEGRGGRIVERLAFKDHHTFTAADAEQLLASADAAGALLVTTEKDYVRLDGDATALVRLKQKSRPLGIAVEFAEGDGARLDALVAAALSSGGYRGGLEHV